MIVLITGPSHTGKTVLAQKLLEQYHYPYLSIDHLKMGLIRSGNTALTPMSDDDTLTDYLWPIVREMIKTAIENRQNLIVEGCYIPFDWEQDFEESYRDQIRYYCLVMTEAYIKKNYSQIKAYASVVEDRLDDSDCTVESLLRDNAQVLSRCREYGVEPVLIQDSYQVCLDLNIDEKAKKEYKNMKIAVTYENEQIFQHFGHTAQFKVYYVENGEIVSTEVLDTNGSGHGALAGLLSVLKVDALICGGIGGGAQMALAEAGVRLYGGVSGFCDAAVEALLAGELAYNPGVRCSHHDQEHGQENHTCGSHGCGSHNCGEHSCH